MDEYDYGTSVPRSVQLSLPMTPLKEPLDRKRRDHINDYIQELGQIIPAEFFESLKLKMSGTKDGKPTKGQILSKAKSYILDLQERIDHNNSIEVKLIAELKELEERKRIPESQRLTNTIFKMPSAVVELAKVRDNPGLRKNKETAKRSPHELSRDLSRDLGRTMSRDTSREQPLENALSPPTNNPSPGILEVGMGRTDSVLSGVGALLMQSGSNDTSQLNANAGLDLANQGLNSQDLDALLDYAMVPDQVKLDPSIVDLNEEDFENYLKSEDFENFQFDF